MKTLVGLLLIAGVAGAETGADAWLRYAPLGGVALQSYRAQIPASVAVVGDSELLRTAQTEMVRGIGGMLGRTLRIESGETKEKAIVIGTVASLKLTGTVGPEGFWLKSDPRGIVIAGADERGALYGTFAFLRRIALGQSIAALDVKDAPAVALRWINQWDNIDGSIERGYGGRSIFWENQHARADMTRVTEYARLLASLGINATSISNVNANPRILAKDFLPEVVKIANALRKYGIRAALSVDFGSPKTIGGLDTFDPIDPKVAAWWFQTMEGVYKEIPDLAGVVLKADSEGRVGPSTYGRTHAEAANVVAKGLKGHGGTLLYRGFVYDHHADWNNPKADRARAAYDNFKPLDGQFDDNVMIQIKHGPIDFQVREPSSPLFGALEKTNEVVELQVTQEYFGQAKHTVFLVPYWKSNLDFDMQAGGPGKATPVKKIVKGFAGVTNVGLDTNWLGNHLSQANLYGFGRLAWNADLTSDAIVREWTRLTFGPDPKVVETIAALQLKSWRAYEDYTGPLGLQTLTDIVGNHYSAAVEASERNGWGQWHFADAQGAGMERTVAKGTGYTSQYKPGVMKMWESLTTCPDDLVLFFHHVPYTHVLHNGKTVIQYLYDSHYQGAETAEGYVKEWESLKGRVDDQRYADVLAQLKYQAGQAQVWRDSVATWFWKTSGIADAKGRVGKYPGRTEAEAMTLSGYKATDVKPWENASGGQGVSCGAGKCSASMKYAGPAGWFDLRVQYFDQINGKSSFVAWLGSQKLASWTAELSIPSRKMDSGSSTRKTISGVYLKPGDEIRVEGTPDQGELAGLDYLEIVAARD